MPCEAYSKLSITNGYPILVMFLVCYLSLKLSLEMLFCTYLKITNLVYFTFCIYLSNLIGTNDNYITGYFHAILIYLILRLYGQITCYNRDL